VLLADCMSIFFPDSAASLYILTRVEGHVPVKEGKTVHGLLCLQLVALLPVHGLTIMQRVHPQNLQ
jgi:hypothetical protein